MIPHNLTPERWQRASALLDALFDLPEADHAAYLDAHCADDPGLRTYVESVLDADASAETFLARPAAEQAAPLVDTLSDRPRRIGRYETERVLGHGGMGIVYLAHRADGTFEQQVALKVIRQSMQTESGVLRFRAERQILAQLQHPSIARLYDGGLTEHGEPYFAMEYVDGLPLTTYCDTHTLSLPERLRLFADVCDAVQHAHRNLVVHRDLKPSNILVTPSGQVKLLDFGIAKVLEQDAASPSTQTGFHALTPAYASPEQVRGEAITTATDVYALGLLLYELLTGIQVQQEASTTPSAVVAVVCEQEPPRPSTAVLRTNDGAAATARGTTPTRLSRTLRTDLDLICQQALHKAPERRYASAEALGADLRRYLSDQPIAARPDALGYQLRKFVRRHRTPVAAGVLVFVALLVGLSGTLWQAQVAAMERDRALQEAAKAREASDFLVNLFNLSNPFSSASVRGDTTTARTLLARGAARITQDLAEQPDLQATMYTTIGHVYRNLNMFAEADTLLHQALALHEGEALLPEDTYAASLAALGQLRQDQGDYPAAESLHRRALTLEQARGASALAQANSQYHLAVALSWQSKQLEEAEVLLRQAIATRTQQLGREHTEVAYALNTLANVLEGQERFEEAEEAHRETLAIRRAVLTDGHPSIAITLNNLALLLRNQERYAEAEPLYREALGILRRELGNAHLYIAVGLNNLADVIDAQQRPADAERIYQEALAVFPILGLEGHPFEAIILSKWGGVLVPQGRYAEAEPALLNSADRIAETFGAEHSFTAKAHARLVTLYEAWGRPDDAEPWRTETTP